MYRTTHFQETRPQALHALMRAYPLATIVCQGAAATDIDHIPLRISEEPDGLHLHGHIARANPLAGGPDRQASAVFTGPQAYVSPGWYASKADHGRVVPTWNYAVVHAHGVLRCIVDPNWLRRHVAALTLEHEAGMACPWRVSDAPEEYVDRMAAAIVGIDLHVASLEGKFKLGQNRLASDRLGVVAGLRSQGNVELADWMATWGS